ncbi:MAG: hypothetical protein HUU01_16035, partial [Saprospiraceae bacterium]|nr:hypothetical protein [Saprospiraceae bacterium]
YTTDLKAALAEAKEHPGKLTEQAAFYGMAARIPFRSLVKKEVIRMLEGFHAPGVENESVNKQLSWKINPTTAEDEQKREKNAGRKARFVQYLLHLWAYVIKK